MKQPATYAAGIYTTLKELTGRGDTYTVLSTPLKSKEAPRPIKDHSEAKSKSNTKN